MTGNEERLSALFYEECRGYTIYSTQEGTSLLHGQGGGAYACFPEFEEAKNLIKYFRAQGQTAWGRMEREVPAEAYDCLNRNRQRNAKRAQYRLVTV